MKSRSNASPLALLPSPAAPVGEDVARSMTRAQTALLREEPGAATYVVATLRLGIAGLLAAACSGGEGPRVTPPPAPPVVTTVEVTPTNATLNVGDTLRAVGVVKDQLGTVMAGRTIDWRSNAVAVASVTADGLVTAVGGGAARIEGTVAGKAGGVDITVRFPVATVILTPDKATVAIGGTVSLGAVVQSALGATLTGRPIAWASLDATIAQVNATGVVTGVSFGRARIVAESEGRADTATVRVPAPPIVFALDVGSARSVSIGPAGGRIETRDGAGILYSLDVPVGALSQPTVIGMTPVRSVEQYPLSGGLAAGVELSPTGLVFAAPATLTIETDRDAPNGTRLFAFAHVTPSARPELLFPRRSGSRITLAVSRLGRAATSGQRIAATAMRSAAQLNTTTPFTVGFGTVSNLLNIQAAYPNGSTAGGFDETALLNAISETPPNAPVMISELARWYDQFIDPALQQASTDLQLLEAYSDFKVWRNMPVELPVLGAFAPALLASIPAMETRALAGRTLFRSKAEDAIRGNFSQCLNAAAGITRPLFVENAFFWINQYLQEGGVYSAATLSLESCARVAPAVVTMPNPVAAGTTNTVDAQFGLLFAGDQVMTPSHMQVSATAQGGTLDRAGGLTAASPRVGFYTTVLTPDAGPGSTQVDFTACYSNTLIVASPDLQNLLCGPTSATRPRVDLSFAVTTTSLPGGTIGLAYTAQLQSIGGQPPILWSVVGGGLPFGLSLNSGTGQISGTPRAVAASRLFTVRARSGATTADKTLSIQVPPPAVEGLFRGNATGGPCASMPGNTCAGAVIWLMHEVDNDYCAYVALGAVSSPPHSGIPCDGSTTVFRFTGSSFVWMDRGGGNVHAAGTATGSAVNMTYTGAGSWSGVQFATQRIAWVRP